MSTIPDQRVLELWRFGLIGNDGTTKRRDLIVEEFSEHMAEISIAGTTMWVEKEDLKRLCQLIGRKL